MRPRGYQRRAVKNTNTSLENGNNPLIVMPTGSGKSIVICAAINNYLSKNIHQDILVLSHRSKILKQDHNALEKYFEGFDIGLYSAGLKSKTTAKITVAGIQSVWRKADKFLNVGLIIVDEAHLISMNKNTMYRKFLDKMEANAKTIDLQKPQIMGLTATHFRLGHGFIHKGENVIFNDLAYDLSSTENYNMLVNDGWLSPMFPTNTKLKINTEKIKKRGGEFHSQSSSKAINRVEITTEACTEIVKFAKEKKLKKWLIFAIDIEHAENIKEMIINLGITCAVVHSEMETGMDEVIRLWEDETYTCVVNVDILTTGLDVPTIDLIGILRPTESPALHVQMLGRGGRPVYLDEADVSTRNKRRAAIKKGPKPCCWIADFAGNTDRLGPINSVMVRQKEKGKGGKGKPITKVCPKCNVITHAAVRICECCGHKFIFREKLSTKSSTAEIVVKKPIKNIVKGGWYEVTDIQYRIKTGKNGGKASMQVLYKCGIRTFSDLIQINQNGYPGMKARNWVKHHVKNGQRIPRTLSELYNIRADLRRPLKVLIKKKGVWSNVIDWKFPRIWNFSKNSY